MSLGDYCFLPGRYEKAKAGYLFTRTGRMSRAERSEERRLTTQDTNELLAESPPAQIGA